MTEARNARQSLRVLINTNPEARSARHSLRTLIRPIASASVSVWTGSAYVPSPVKVWTGSTYANAVVKTWDGTKWVPEDMVPGLDSPLLLWDVRTWVSGNLINQGSLGGIYNMSLDAPGFWERSQVATSFSTAFGGAPSYRPITFMCKASSALVKSSFAYGMISIELASDFNKFIEGEFALTNSTAYVQAKSTTGSVPNDMGIVYSEPTPSATFPGALFFLTLDFSDPAGGLKVIRNSIDETGGIHISTVDYGIVGATPGYIDSMFNAPLSMYVEIDSSTPSLGCSGMGMFRGTPNTADLAAWAFYWS